MIANKASEEEDQTNDLYEFIGSRIVECWDVGTGEVPAPQNLFQSPHVQRLKEILATPINQLLYTWADDLARINEAMTPAEYAVYGQKLIKFLLNVRTAQGGLTNQCYPLNRKFLTTDERHPSSSRDASSNLPRPFPAWLPTNSET
jgi:hypothetical protein